jgi:acetyl/propionyl-CoA carboxylase alpha subunit
MRYITTIGEREFLVEILDDHHVSIDGVIYNINLETVSGQPVYSLLVDNRSYEALVYPSDEDWQVLLHGALYSVLVEDEREKRLRASLGGGPAEHGEYFLKAPMPGLVVAVPVQDGQEVEKGDVLVILESMKMQNELKAPRAGMVARVRIKPGDSVELKETLLSVI